MLFRSVSQSRYGEGGVRKVCKFVTRNKTCAKYGLVPDSRFYDISHCLVHAVGKKCNGYTHVKFEEGYACKVEGAVNAELDLHFY